MEISSVVPWGRSLAEYRAMFALADSDLERRILGAGDGPASFNAELSRHGGRVVSVDPMYQFSASAIRSRVQRVYPGLLAQVAQKPGNYQWTTFKNPSHLGSIRMSAMNAFLDDFDAGRAAGRYIDASLPSLPFDDDEFDLAVCSHLLFAYSEQVGVDQHIAALLELSRVATEVRVYPLLAEDGKVSSHLPVVMRTLADAGINAEMAKVPYQFQKGATEMLRLIKQSEVFAMPADFSGKGVQSTTSGEVFGGDTALPCTVVTTDLCRAVVSHQGAQLLSFQPRGGEEWLWLSPLAQFVSGSAIRGGIPLCLPWFGRHQSGDSLPKHGFCRLREWDLVAVDKIDQAVCLRFEYASTEADLALFPWRFRAEIQYRLSNHLILEFSIENLDGTPMPLSFAMHSYFAVSSLANTHIEGIDQAEYLDNTRDLQRGLQREALVFGKEVDKVFPGLGGEQLLTDKLVTRYVAGSGCDTAIIWNPGNDSLADIGSHFSEFVCLERGIAFDDAQALAPGHRWEAFMSISDKGSGHIA